MPTFKNFQQTGHDMIERDVKGFETAIQKEYARSLRIVRQRLKNQYSTLAGVKPENYYNEMLKFGRLQKLEKSIVDEINRLTAYTRRQTAQATSLSAANTYYMQQYATNWLVPYKTVFLPEKMIEFITYGTPEVLNSIKNSAVRDSLLKTAPKSGTTIRSLFANKRDNDVKRIIQKVTSGIIQGDSAVRVSKSIKRELEISASNSMRIIRTESHRAANSGHYMQWETAKASGVDGYRQIVSTLDQATRQQSAQVDGAKDTGGGFLYPDGNRYEIPGNTGVPEYDINDRETVINVVGGYSPQIRTGRDPITGETESFEWKNFDSWAEEKGLEYNSYGRLVKKGA